MSSEFFYWLLFGQTTNIIFFYLLLTIFHYDNCEIYVTLDFLTLRDYGQRCMVGGKMQLLEIIDMGGNLCLCVGFVCQLISIRLYRSTLTRHVY